MRNAFYSSRDIYRSTLETKTISEDWNEIKDDE